MDKVSGGHLFDPGKEHFFFALFHLYISNAYIIQTRSSLSGAGNFFFSENLAGEAAAKFVEDPSIHLETLSRPVEQLSHNHDLERNQHPQVGSGRLYQSAVVFAPAPIDTGTANDIPTNTESESLSSATRSSLTLASALSGST